MITPQFLTVAGFTFLLTTGFTQAGEVLQFDTLDVFNTRVISTVVGGQLLPLKNDIDGAGGVATTSAAGIQGPADPHALPDDGKFPATDRHPAIVLPYAKDDAKAPQVRRCTGGDAFVLTVPVHLYGKFFLLLSSGQGASHLKIKMRYTDHTTDTRTADVPDWFWELKPEDRDWSYVATNLSKWGPDKMLEKDHHSIFALDLHPDPTKTLEKILVSKADPGIMVFYGATGETAP